VELGTSIEGEQLAHPKFRKVLKAIAEPPRTFPFPLDKEGGELCCKSSLLVALSYNPIQSFTPDFLIFGLLIC
jgi:hypothetical protein